MLVMTLTTRTTTIRRKVMTRTNMMMKKREKMRSTTRIEATMRKTKTTKMTKTRLMTMIGPVMMTNKKGQKNYYSADNKNSDRKDEGMDDNANHKIDNDDKEHEEDKND